MRLVYRMRDIYRKNKPTSTVLLRSWSISAQQKLRFKVYKLPFRRMTQNSALLFIRCNFVSSWTISTMNMATWWNLIGRIFQVIILRCEKFTNKNIQLISKKYTGKYESIKFLEIEITGKSIFFLQTKKMK